MVAYKRQERESVRMMRVKWFFGFMIAVCVVMISGDCENFVVWAVWEAVWFTLLIFNTMAVEDERIQIWVTRLYYKLMKTLIHTLIVCIKAICEAVYQLNDTLMTE